MWLINYYVLVGGSILQELVNMKIFLTNIYNLKFPVLQYLKSK